MKKRIGLLLTVAAVMAAMVAISAAGASAQPVCTTTNVGNIFTRTCVETTTNTFQETVTTSRGCEVGNSGRQGTQAGTQTNTFQTTTTTTTTQAFQGNPNANKPLGDPVTTTVTSDPVLIEEGPFTPTGPCRNISGPQR